MDRDLTNLGYARGLDRGDLPLIIKVAKAYIASVVGVDAPLWLKERAYSDWCAAPYDDYLWSKMRRERAGKAIVFD